VPSHLVGASNAPLVLEGTRNLCKLFFRYCTAQGLCLRHGLLAKLALRHSTPARLSDMPDSSKHTFNTLARESAFRRPPTGGSAFPILNEFIAPHIESFNALFDDSGLPFGDGNGLGLLSSAIKDIGERVVFDRARQSSSQSSHGWGNRLSSKNSDFFYSSFSPLRNLSLDRTSLYRATNGSRQRPTRYRAQGLSC
jgi:hypothetical protein